MDLVSVLVCTRERPSALVRLLRSLLTPRASIPFELIVIDQSDGPESFNALGDLVFDPHLRYVRAASRGAGAALQEGLQLAQGEIIVCADDDCEAPPGWIENMVRVTNEHPTAGLVFCSVVAAPHDPSCGYVPSYTPRQSRLVRSVAATCWGHGISAGMAARRRAVIEIGGFDEALGPGARFPAGDDWDIAFRALLAGWHVFEAADVEIVHHGFRTYVEGRAHARRDWLGIGAVCSKLPRSGRVTALAVPIWEFSVHALLPPVIDLVQLRRPRGLSRIVGFMQGFITGLRTPIDKRTLKFATKRDVPRRPSPAVERRIPSA